MIQLPDFKEKVLRFNKDNVNGFTLIEVLIAIVILSFGLLGMASLTVGIIKGNKFSNNLSTATTLAQDKMEDTRRLGYSGMPSADTTTSEDYGTITGYTDYKRVTETDVYTVGTAFPPAGMKVITITAYWKDPNQVEHSVELKSILKQ